jgi:hypothetical protein
MNSSDYHLDAEVWIFLMHDNQSVANTGCPKQGILTEGKAQYS